MHRRHSAPERTHRIVPDSRSLHGHENAHGRMASAPPGPAWFASLVPTGEPIGVERSAPDVVVFAIPAHFQCSSLHFTLWSSRFDHRQDAGLDRLGQVGFYRAAVSTPRRPRTTPVPRPARSYLSSAGCFYAPS